MAAVAVNAEPARDEHKTPPWWTEADAAELHALTWALVDGWFEHRERCTRCARARETGIACPHTQKAVQIVVDWRHARELESRARWLRLQRELLQYERDLLVFKAGR